MEQTCAKREGPRLDKERQRQRRPPQPPPRPRNHYPHHYDDKDSHDVIKCHEPCIPILIERGEAYAVLGHVPAALRDWQSILAFDPEHACALAKIRAWTKHFKMFHINVDQEAFLRSFEISTTTGAGRRRQDAPQHRIVSSTDIRPDERPDQVQYDFSHGHAQTQERTETVLNEMDHPEAFAARCQEMRHIREMAAQAAIAAQDTATSERTWQLERIKSRCYEVVASRRMETEEEDSRRRFEAIAQADMRLAIERMREAHTRKDMAKEETYQRAMDAAHEQMRLDALAAEEEARKKAADEAEYQKRLARRGGSRQVRASVARGMKKPKSPEASR